MDYVTALAKAIKVYKRLKTAKRVADSVIRNMASTTFLGDDEKIREMDRVTRHLHEVLSDTISWKENEWAFWSGVNSLDPATKEPAIRKLSEERQACRDMAEAIDGLSLMLKALLVMDVMDLRKLARPFSASLMAMNEIDRQMVLTQLGGLHRGMQEAQERISNVITTLERS